MFLQESSTQGIQGVSIAVVAVSKCNICTLNCTLEEIAAHIGKSERTVKTITVNLTEKGIIEHKNGKRNGYWEIKTNDLNR